MLYGTVALHRGAVAGVDGGVGGREQNGNGGMGMGGWGGRGGGGERECSGSQEGGRDGSVITSQLIDWGKFRTGVLQRNVLSFCLGVFWGQGVPFGLRCTSR